MKRLVLKTLRIVFSLYFLGLSTFAFSVISLSAYLIVEIERETNPGFTTFLDGLWWAVATITTVGYGDIYPMTDKGRILGIILMMAGSALFVSFTGYLAAKFLETDLDL